MDFGNIEINQSAGSVPPMRSSGMNLRWRIFTGALAAAIAAFGLTEGGLFLAHNLRGSSVVDAAGCPTDVSAKPHYDQTLRVGLNVEPPSLDPAAVDPVAGSEILSLTVEPLLRASAGLDTVVPAAADSYSVSSDGLTYRFHIRPGERFSNGHPITAQDFVYSWQRLLDPRTASDSAVVYAQYIRGGEDVLQLSAGADKATIDSRLSGLGLSAPDPQTFQVTLSSPHSDFAWLATRSSGAPVDQAVVADTGSKWASDPATDVVNGPYAADEIVPGDHYTLVPNPMYWGPAPRLTQVVMVAGLKPDAAITAYRKGDLDMVDIPADAKIDVAATGRELVRTPDLTVDWLAFDTSRPPFDNAQLRQALIHSVDRQALIDEALGGRGVPVTSLVPPGVRGYSADAGRSEQSFDVQAAKAALATSGVTPEQLASATLVARDTPAAHALAEALQKQWKANLGIDVKFSFSSGAVADPVEHPAGAVGPQGFRPLLPDPADYASAFSSAGSAEGATYTNTAYDNAVQLAATSAPAIEDNLVATAQQQLFHDGAALFLDARQGWHLVKPHVTGYATSALDGSLVGSACSETIYVAAH